MVNPDTAPPSLSGHGILLGETPCYAVFRFTARIDSGPQTALNKQWRSKGFFICRYVYVQGGSNTTWTDLCVNKPHCAAAVRP